MEYHDEFVQTREQHLKAKNSKIFVVNISLNTLSAQSTITGAMAK